MSSPDLTHFRVVPPVVVMWHLEGARLARCPNISAKQPVLSQFIVVLTLPRSRCGLKTSRCVPLIWHLPRQVEKPIPKYRPNSP